MVSCFFVLALWIIVIITPSISSTIKTIKPTTTNRNDHDDPNRADIYNNSLGKRVNKTDLLQTTNNHSTTAGTSLHWADYFRGINFQDYKAWIDHKMETRRQQRKAIYKSLGIRQRWKSTCVQSLYHGEFGMELQAFVPWAYYKSYHGCYHLKTFGVTGSKYMYWFSDDHRIVRIRRRFIWPKHGMPVFPTREGIYVQQIPDHAPWQAPPFKDFFYNPKVASFKELQDKPLVVIQNKYHTEWGGPPTNFFDKDMLSKMFDYMVPHYSILYKRHTSKSLTDNSQVLDLNEKEWIRTNYPSVVLYEDLQQGLDSNDPNDENLLQFGIMAISQHFVAVQGGTAALSAWFGGNTSILIKKGPDSECYHYFHRFSNATVVWKDNDTDFLQHLKQTM